MKKTAALIGKLIRLANGETLPASSLRGDWFEQMQADDIFVPVTHGSRKSLRVADTSSFRSYLASQYYIRDLEQTFELLSNGCSDRASLVDVTGDSKFLSHRTFTGFLVNSYQPIDAVLSGKPLTILPPDGTFIFIADYQHFCIPKDVVIIGVENAENFRYVARQKYLFEEYGKVLFVSRYPQNQHKDLLKWLMSISNKYVHFGDLDLAGVAIYQNEFYRHLGVRASFFVPKDYEERISMGNIDLYNSQLPQYGKMNVEDERVSKLISCIHRCHRGYEQEGFIMKQIEVVAAIIRKGDKIFATQRGYGEWKDWWEFPGGKMEAGETPEKALVREIREELSTEISVDEFLCTVEYDYPKFQLTMHCYLCSLLTEALHLNEHEAARWLGKDELGSVKWLPADLLVIEILKCGDQEHGTTDFIRNFDHQKLILPRRFYPDKDMLASSFPDYDYNK